MNIEISNQTTQRIEAVLGPLDPTTINVILGRVANDEQLLLSLMADEPDVADIQAIQEGLDAVVAGRSRPFSEFMSELRGEMNAAQSAES